MTELVNSKSGTEADAPATEHGAGALPGLAAEGISEIQIETDDTHESSHHAGSPGGAESAPLSPLGGMVWKPSIALRDDPHYRIAPDKYHGWFRGYVRQDWGTINVEQGGELEELRAGWIELFFDLVYVAGIVHISAEAVYTLPVEDSRRRLGGDTTTDGDVLSKNFDFLFCTFVQFGLLVQAWNESVSIESKFASDQHVDAILRFSVMLGILLMGSSIKDEEQYFQFFLVSFVIVKFFVILTYSKLSLIPRARNHCLLNVLINGLLIILSIVLLMTVSGNALHWIYAYSGLWCVAYCGQWLQWVKIERIQPRIPIPVNVPHMAERLGLFTMLILGEAIISLMTADDDSLDFGFFGWVSLCVVAFLSTYSMGLLYFSCQPPEEKILTGTDTHAMKLGPARARLFFISHTLLQFALLGYGVGVKIVSAHLGNEEDQAIDVMMPSYSLLAACVALNLIRLSHPFENRTRWVWMVRMGCLVVMLVLPLFWEIANQFAIGVGVTICILIQVAVDEEGQLIKKERKHERKEKTKEAVERQQTRHGHGSHGSHGSKGGKHGHGHGHHKGSGHSAEQHGMKDRTVSDSVGGSPDTEKGDNEEKDSDRVSLAQRDSARHSARQTLTPHRHLKKQYSGVGGSM